MASDMENSNKSYDVEILSVIHEESGDTAPRNSLSSIMEESSFSKPPSGSKSPTLNMKNLPATYGTTLATTYNTTLANTYGTTLPSNYNTTMANTYGTTLPSTYNTTIANTYGTTMPSTYNTTLVNTYGTTLPSTYNTTLANTYGTTLASPYGNALHSTYGTVLTSNPGTLPSYMANMGFPVNLKNSFSNMASSKYSTDKDTVPSNIAAGRASNTGPFNYPTNAGTTNLGTAGLPFSMDNPTNTGEFSSNTGVSSRYTGLEIGNSNETVPPKMGSLLLNKGTSGHLPSNTDPSQTESTQYPHTESMFPSLGTSSQPLKQDNSAHDGTLPPKLNTMLSTMGGIFSSMETMFSSMDTMLSRMATSTVEAEAALTEANSSQATKTETMPSDKESMFSNMKASSITLHNETSNYGGNMTTPTSMETSPYNIGMTTTTGITSSNTEAVNDEEAFSSTFGAATKLQLSSQLANSIAREITSCNTTAANFKSEANNITSGWIPMMTTPNTVGTLSTGVETSKNIEASNITGNPTNMGLTTSHIAPYIDNSPNNSSSFEQHPSATTLGAVPSNTGAKMEITNSMTVTANIGTSDCNNEATNLSIRSLSGKLDAYMAPTNQHPLQSAISATSSLNVKTPRATSPTQSVSANLPPGESSTALDILSNTLNRLEKTLTCGACHQVYDDPHLLSCQHSMCKTCINKLATNDHVLCPDCNTYCSVESITQNTTMAQMIGFYHTEKSSDNLVPKESKQFLTGAGDQPTMTSNDTTTQSPESPQEDIEKQKQQNAEHPQEMPENSMLAKEKNEEKDRESQEKIAYLREIIRKTIEKVYKERDFLLTHHFEQQARAAKKLDGIQTSLLKKVSTYFEHEICMGQELIENIVKETKTCYGNELDTLAKCQEDLRSLSYLEDTDPKAANLLIQKIQLELLNLRNRMGNIQMRELEVVSDEVVGKDLGLDKALKVVLCNKVSMKTVSHNIPSFQWMLGQTLYPVKEFPLKMWVNRMLIVGNTLWCLTTRGIRLYKLTGNDVKLITESDKSGIGLACTTEGYIMVAAMDRGLLQFDRLGFFKTQVSDGCYHDVTCTRDLVYAINKDRAAQTIWMQTFTYEDNSYKPVQQIKTNIDFTKTTLSCAISNNYMYICKNADSSVYKLGLCNGKILQKFGQVGQKYAGEMRGPSLCGTDDFGRLLFIDYCNRCLQILEPESGLWTKVPITGNKYPVTALARGNDQVLIAIDNDFVIGFFSTQDKATYSVEEEGNENRRCNVARRGSEKVTIRQKPRNSGAEVTLRRQARSLNTFK